MQGLISPRFWFQTFASVLVTMIIIYFIKKFSIGANVPVLRELSEGI